MQSVRPVLLSLALALTGCERCSPPWEPSPESPARGSEAASETPNAETAPSTPAPEGVTLHGEADAYGAIAIRLEVRGPDPLRVDDVLRLERREDGDFAAVEDLGAITLRPDCQTAAVDCIALVAGAELRPPPIGGRAGVGQCGGPAEARALPAGEYRIVATTCDGEHRIESAPFTK